MGKYLLTQSKRDSFEIATTIYLSSDSENEHDLLIPEELNRLANKNKEEDSKWLADKKNELAYKIIYEGALLPSKKQAAMSVIAFFAFAYLAYTTGPSFLHYAILGRDKVPGIQTINSALSPLATEWVNIILNFYILNLVGYIGIIRYLNDYLLKKSSNVKTKIWRDIGQTSVSGVYAILSSIPFGALALASGSLFAVILQLIVFSSMQVIGSTSLISATVLLLFSVYNYFKNKQKSTDKNMLVDENILADDKWDEKIQTLSNDPATLLDELDLSTTEGQEKDLPGKIDAINSPKDKTSAAGYYVTLSALMALFGIAAYGYFALTKGAGVNAIFGKDNIDATGRWILGTIFFLPFAGFGLYSQSETAQSISSILESSLKRVLGKSQASQPQRWSNWLYVTRAALAVMVIGGYFFGYLSGAAAIALNEQAGLRGEFVNLLTCFGAMLFNGFGFYGLAKKLDWVLTTLITYKPKEWSYAFNASLVDGFFKRHKGDLEEERVLELPILLK